MNTTKIVIKNLYGLTELEMDGSSVELTGNNGVGKTSVIDAIRYALTNDSEREYVIKNGEKEGEILIETDTGLSINRKKRAEQSDYKSIKQDDKVITRPESFLQTIFSELQLNPVEFTQMSRQEQNRRVLDLIDFKWDLNWIKNKFGELPNVNYEQNILKVLHDIQDEKGSYFMERQELNREARFKRDHISEIVKDIPDKYDYQKWDKFDLDSKYEYLNTLRKENGRIESARVFKESYDGKLRSLEAEKEISITTEIEKVSSTRETLTADIERLKGEILAKEEKLSSLNENFENRKAVIEAEYREKVSKLNADTGLASEYAGREPKDVVPLENEINYAKQMIKHLNEYKRMETMQKELSVIVDASDELTRKIELARELPSEILKESKIPVKGLTIENGTPLINGLPISNLSEGEQLKLCVEIAISKPNSLKIILLDGTEKLSDENRLALYDACRAKGLQFIASRTTNESELKITNLSVPEIDEVEEMLGGAL